MEENRLPQNGKEGLLYGSIICILTVIIMTTLNISIEFGKLDGEVALIILKSIPIVWIIAMLIEVLVVGKIAEKLVNKFTESTDGFNTKILFNILFCVIGMSVIMTIIGNILGNGISLEIFTKFPLNWPRNFCVAFLSELLIIHPIARLVMKKIHTKNNV
jgi:hypothetical protein